MDGWHPNGLYVYRRLMLNFKVDTAALGSRLPAGWKPLERLGGSNLTVGLCEVLLHVDAEGTPIRNPKYHYVPVNGNAVHEESGEQANMRYLTLSDRPEDADGCLTALVHATHSLHVDATVRPIVLNDSYRFSGEDGSMVSADVIYEATVPTLYRSPLPGMRVRCPDDLSRLSLYRNEELHEVLFDRSSRLESFRRLDYRVKIRQLSDLFDGTEALVSVIAVPWSRREVFSATPAV